MATITINIPTDKTVWILDGFAHRYNYQENVPNPAYDARVTIPNPAYDPTADIPNPAYDDQIPEDPGTNPSTIPNPSYDPNVDIPNPDFDDVTELPNPESRAAFAKRFVIQYIKTIASQGHLHAEQQSIKAEQDAVDLT